MKEKTVETKIGTFIQVYECPHCGTTYRKSSVITRFWKFCPNCGTVLEPWEGKNNERV